MRTRTAAVVLVLVVSVAAGCGPSSTTTQKTAVETPPVATAPAPGGGKGRIETQRFASAALGVDKDYLVYLPAGYDADATTRFPVLYYLHGLTGDETNWTENGDLAGAADALGLRAIVVMPDGDDSFYTNAVGDYDYDKCLADGSGLFIPGQPKHKTCVRHRAYETYVIEDLIKEVDGRYRTIATRDGRAIAGLSMGGFGALKLALKHKDLFAAAASHSGVDSLIYRGPHPYVAGKVELMKPTALIKGAGMMGAWFATIFGTDDANWLANDPTTLIASLAPGELGLYLDCGTEDEFKLDGGAHYLHELLTAKRIPVELYIGPGAHNFEFWKARLPHSLAFLAAHVAAPK